MTEDERSEYFHRVEVTTAILGGLESEIAAHNGQVWSITFNSIFQFHLVDRSHKKVTRDYGWYPTWAELVGKIRREFPDMEFNKLLT